MMCASFGRALSGAEQTRQRLGVDAVGLQLDRVQRRTALAQRRAACGRRSGARRPRRRRGARGASNRNASACIEPLVTSTSLGLDAVPVGDPRAQARVADRRAVGGRAGGVAVERAVGGVAQPLHVDDVERWGAAREGDRRSGGGWHGRVGYASEQLVVVMGQLARRALQAIAEAQQLRGTRRLVRRRRWPAHGATCRLGGPGVDDRRVRGLGGHVVGSSAAARGCTRRLVGGRTGGRREGRWREGGRRAARRWRRSGRWRRGGWRRGGWRRGAGVSLLRQTGCGLACRRRAELLAVEGLVDEPARTGGLGKRSAHAGVVAAVRRLCRVTPGLAIADAAEDAFELAQLALELSQRVRDLLIHERQA